MTSYCSIFSEFNQFLFIFLIMHLLLFLNLFFIYLMSVWGYLTFECYITVSLCFEKFWEWGRIFIRWIVWVIILNFIFIGLFCCLSVFSVCWGGYDVPSWSALYSITAGEVLLLYWMAWLRNSHVSFDF